MDEIEFVMQKQYKHAATFDSLAKEIKDFVTFFSSIFL
jgi:hypothetical protein